MKVANADVLSIMRVLVLEGRQNRGELSARLGVSVSSVSRGLERLGAAGLIRGELDGVSAGGRPPVQYSLADLPAHTVSVSIGQHGVAAAAYDLVWKRIARIFVPRALMRCSADEVLTSATGAVTELLEHAGLTAEQCLAFGCSVWGNTTEGRTATLFWPYRRDLRDIPLADRLTERFGAPAVVDDGVRHVAMAIQHHRMAATDVRATGVTAPRGGRDTRDFLLVTEQGGFAAVLGGAVYRGTSGLGGELAHFVVDSAGPRCQCGDRGCLLAVSSRHAILQRLRAAAGAGLHPALAGLLNGEDTESDAGGVADATGERSRVGEALLEAASEGDRLAARVLVEVGTAAGRAVAGTINLLGVETVFVSGGIVERSDVAWEALLQAVRPHVVEVLEPRVRIQRVPPMPDGGALGAARHAFEHVLTAEPARAHRLLLAEAIK